jgi:methionyl-tRNA formyltransferase
MTAPEQQKADNGTGMLENIVILAAQPQQHFAIGLLLKEHNPALSITPATTLADLHAIDRALLKRSRLIAFTSGTIVPSEILDAVGYGAYNFHPGPPEYPGWAPAHFAIYQRAAAFGVTAHVMTERVDEGEIIGVESFAVPATISVRGLEQMAYVRLAHLMWRLAKELATRAEPLEKLSVAWGRKKSSRRDYEMMCTIDGRISPDELQRRIHAFNDQFRGIVPTIELHGFRFRVSG